MSTVASSGVRRPGTIQIPRGAEPLNQRLAAEIDAQLAATLGKNMLVNTFALGGQKVIIHMALELIIYAFRTSQLKAEPRPGRKPMVQLKRDELVYLDDSVLASVERTTRNHVYDASMIVNDIIGAYSVCGYQICEP